MSLALATTTGSAIWSHDKPLHAQRLAPAVSTNDLLTGDAGEWGRSNSKERGGGLA